MPGVRLVIEVDDKGSAKIRQVGKAHDALERNVVAGSSKMSKAVDRLRARWQTMRATVGRVATYAKFALAGLAIAAAVTGAKFEQSMANVAAVSSATEQQLEQLTATARGLGATTAFSASQAADAMMALAQAGQTVAEIQQTVGDVLLFAGAASTDLGSAAESLVQTLAQFGLEASESNRVVNVFAASMTTSLLNAERLREGLSQVGSTAAAVGLRLEETVATLGLLNNAGQLGGIAGTRLKNVLVRLAAPNAVLRDLLKGVTLEADGLAASMEALADADPGKIFKAFGRIAAPAVLVMRSQTEELARLEEQITGTTKAQEMFETQMNTVASQFKIFKSQLQENMIATFYAARDAGFDAIGGLTDVLATLKPYVVGTVAVVVRWFQANRELVGTILKIGAAVGGAVAVIAFLSSGVGMVTAAVVAGGVVWSKWGDKIRGAVVKAVDAVVGFASSFIESHETAIETTLGIVKGFINAVIGLAVFLGLTFWDVGREIVKALRAPFGWIVDRIRGLVEWAGPILKKLGVAFGREFEQITADLESNAGEQEQILGKAGQAIADNARTAFGTDYVGAVVGGVSTATNLAKQKLVELKNAAVDVGNEIKKTGEAAGGRVDAPGTSTADGDADAHIAAYVEAMKAAAAERAANDIEAGRKAEDQRRAQLVETIGFADQHTQDWLDARLELIRSNYDEELAAAGDNAEQVAQLRVERSAEVAEARKEHETAVLEHFMETNRLALITLDALGAGYDAFFDQVARGEVKSGRIREAVFRSVRSAFVKNTAAMIKFWIKQQLLGLVTTRAAKDADAAKDKFADAKAGARKAYSAFASIPIIGPALGAAAAAAAFAFLMAFNAGGKVPGFSTNRDTVPAILEPGEFVVRQSSASSIGDQALEYINRTGALPPAPGGEGVTEINLNVPDGDPDVVEYLERVTVPALMDIRSRRAGLQPRRNVL